MGEQKEVLHAARVEIGLGVSGKASWRRLLLVCMFMGEWKLVR